MASTPLGIPPFRNAEKVYNTHTVYAPSGKATQKGYRKSGCVPQFNVHLNVNLNTYINYWP